MDKACKNWQDESCNPQPTLKLRRKFQKIKSLFCVILNSFQDLSSSLRVVVKQSRMELLRSSLRSVLAMTMVLSLILNSLFLIPTFVYAASSPWTQTDWSGGSGQTSWSDNTKFDSSSSVTTSTAGQVTLTNTEKLSNTGFETDTSSWTAATVNLATSLISYWELSETSDGSGAVTRNDSVGSNNLTDYNTVTSGSGGPPPPDGGWGQFTATNSEYLAINSNSTLQVGDIDFTVAGWMWLDDLGQTANRTPWGKYNRSTNSREYTLTTTGGSTLRLWLSCDGLFGSCINSYDSTVPVSASTWYFVVFWHDSVNNQVGMSINNQATPNTWSRTTGVYTGTASFSIGSLSGVEFYANGRAAGIGFWKKVLTAAEITYLYNSGNGLAYPFYTLTRDTTTTYNSSAGSAKVVAVDTTNLTQSVNVGDTNTYSFSAYAYTDGSAVSSSDVSLYYNGSTVSTTYTSVGSGWYQLTGTVTGVASSVDTGVQVAAGKTVYLDDISLNNYASSGTLTSSIFDTEYSSGAAWGTLTYNATTPSNTSVSVKARTSNSSSMTGATAFASCTATTSGSDISSNSCVTDSHRYIQYQLSLANTDSISTPTFQDVSIAFSAYDTDAPSISLTALSPDPSSDNTPTVSGTATESIGTVSNVQLQMDATSGSWTACTAGDGALDEASEAFSCTPSALSDGSHTMYVRATDSNSNTTASGSESSDTFTIDATAPTSIDLDSPGDNSYTNSERPTFKWKATTDATAGLSKYVLEIDNSSIGSGQPSGDFSIDSIPPSKTSDYEANKYLIHYENFNDSDSTNNYISVHTKSHSDWGSSENDGKLREGRVSWKVKAVDSAGNETSSSRTLFVDRTNPNLEFIQINDAKFSTSSNNNFSTTDKTPTIFGKITDPLAGGDSSKTQDESGPKIASGPKQVDIKVEKKDDLGYKLLTLYKINMDNPYYTCDADKTIDNSKQKCDKYLPFEYTPKENLDLGQYKITLSGKDKADNPAPDGAGQVLTLNITTLSQITTPEEKEIIEEALKPAQGEKPLTSEEKEKVKEELQITKPTTTSAPTPSPGADNFFKKIFGGIISTADNFLSYLQGVGSYAGQTIGQGLKQPKQLARNLGDWVSYSTTSFGEIVLDSEPTKIAEVKVEKLTSDSVIITWKTNHLATSKVNYGETLDYGKDVQSGKKVHEHKVEITGLQPNRKYYYEVMSQNKNYVYDANHEFTTLEK